MCSDHWIESTDQPRWNPLHQDQQQHSTSQPQSDSEEESFEEVITTTTETRQSLEYYPIILMPENSAFYIRDPFAVHHH